MSLISGLLALILVGFRAESMPGPGNWVRADGKSFQRYWLANEGCMSDSPFPRKSAQGKKRNDSVYVHTYILESPPNKSSRLSAENLKLSRTDVPH